MKRLAMAIFSAAAALTLGACADNYGGGGYASAGPMDVWYDGFYGPYDAGYWDGEAFFFRGRDGHFTRDEGRHFRHERFASAQGFRSTPRPSAAESGANASASAPQASPSPSPPSAAPPPQPSPARPH